MAESVEYARAAAIKLFMERLEEDHCIYVDITKDKSTWDEDEREQFDRLDKEFLADLAEEPTTESVILIHGSA